MKAVREILIVLVVLAVFKTTYGATYRDPQDFPKAFAFVPNLQASYDIAKSQGKPIMLVIQSSGCPACQALRPVLAKSSKIKRLSNSFVMVNGADKKDAAAEAIKPDRQSYFPRIIFFDSNGNVLKNVQNPSRDDYVYFYEQESDVIASMNQAIAVNNAN